MFFISGCQSTEQPRALVGVKSSAEEVVSRVTSEWVRGFLRLSDGKTIKVVTDIPAKDGYLDPAAALEASRQLWKKAQEEGVSEADLPGSFITVGAESRFGLPQRDGLGIALPLLSREPAFLGQVAELKMHDGRSVVVHADPVIIDGFFDLAELKNTAQAVLGAAWAAGISETVQMRVSCNAMSVDGYLNNSFFSDTFRECSPALANAELIMLQRNRKIVPNVEHIDK